MELPRIFHFPLVLATYNSERPFTKKACLYPSKTTAPELWLSDAVFEIFPLKFQEQKKTILSRAD
jgi:hypothetical protein